MTCCTSVTNEIDYIYSKAPRCRSHELLLRRIGGASLFFSEGIGFADRADGSYDEICIPISLLLLSIASDCRSLRFRDVAGARSKPCKE